MKILIKIMMCSCLTACYPCKFLDWNCNERRHDDAWDALVNQCTVEQIAVAEMRLGSVSKKMKLDIYDECILSDGKYKFKSGK